MSPTEQLTKLSRRGSTAASDFWAGREGKTGYTRSYEEGQHFRDPTRAWTWVRWSHSSECPEPCTSLNFGMGHLNPGRFK